VIKRTENETCFIMANMASWFCGFYFVFACFVSCVVNQRSLKQQDLSVEYKHEYTFSRKRKQDDLGWFINELADQKSIPDSYEDR